MVHRRSSSEILKKRARPTEGINARLILKYSLLVAAFFILLGILTSVIVYFYLSKDLQKISSLTDYHPSIITEVYSDDNRKIAEFYHERRVVVPLSDMPAMLIEAFIASEDARFYKHQGVDFFSIVRAFIKNLQAGEIVQGGSTITQQVTKSFFLTPERSYSRKIKEAILAYRIDKAFSKQEILYLYLNQIYLGHAAYGVEAASENYFGKSAKELNLAECAILA
ncbi:MAG: penicillin-binding protein, partial [Desulfobacterales bacterium]|nr:penicillin-binding protein [Desulfobacterales bacterium]